MTARTLGLDDTAVSQIFRRMAFNVMARNCDDHTKNFGFILRQGEPWNLAPAYDVTHAYNPQGVWTYQHQMSVNRKFEDISKEDLLAVADRFSVRKPESLLSDVRAAIDNWSQFAKQADLSPALQSRIANQLLPL
jgi:serine/threonine-protein kinase HipA